MRRPQTSRLQAFLAATALLSVAGCGKGDETASTATTAGPAATTDTPSAAGCKRVAAPRPRDVKLDRPSSELDAGKRYVVRLETSCGAIEMALDQKAQPRTAASFVFLARKGVFDGTTFGRIGKDPSGGDFVIQGGDPTQTGSGGPGYSVTEKPPSAAKYTRGVVAMAKTEIERAGTSGSQFFIVTAKDAALPADYAVLGKVTGGEETVKRIAGVPSDPQTEAPLSPVVIEKATVSEK